MSAFTIRRARPDDIPAMARMAAELVRQHHAFDADRFILPDDVERGYAWWFGREQPSKQVVMFVAEGADGALAGYTYARLEDHDWNALLAEHGALHDIYVAEPARRAGAGAALLGATLDALRELGAPRVVLSSAWENHSAHRLFERAGFRKTMIEMTCELQPAGGTKQSGP